MELILFGEENGVKMCSILGNREKFITIIKTLSYEHINFKCEVYEYTSGAEHTRYENYKSKSLPLFSNFGELLQEDVDFLNYKEISDVFIPSIKNGIFTDEKLVFIFEDNYTNKKSWIVIKYFYLDFLIEITGSIFYKVHNYSVQLHNILEATY